jgi:sugar phosphate permease
MVVSPLFLTAALAVAMRADLAFDKKQLGIVVSVFFIGVALSAVPAGRLVERLGAWVSFRIGMLLSVLTMVSIATWASSWPLTLFISFQQTKLLFGALSDGPPADPGSVELRGRRRRGSTGF